MPRDEMRKASSTRPPCASRLAALLGSVARRPRSDRRAGPQSFVSIRASDCVFAPPASRATPLDAVGPLLFDGPPRPRRGDGWCHLRFVVARSAARRRRATRSISSCRRTAPRRLLRAALLAHLHGRERTRGTWGRAARPRGGANDSHCCITQHHSRAARRRERASARVADVPPHGTGVRLILRSACAAPLRVLRALRMQFAQHERAEARGATPGARAASAAARD